MNQKDYEILVTNMINAIAKRIFELVNQGCTKEQIIEYFKKSGWVISWKRWNNRFIFRKNGFNKCCCWKGYIYLVQKRALQPEIRRLYQYLVDEKNLTYIGKDGRDYYSREALEEANKQYMDQMYTET